LHIINLIRCAIFQLTLQKHKKLKESLILNMEFIKLGNGLFDFFKIWIAVAWFSNEAVYQELLVKE